MGRIKIWLKPAFLIILWITVLSYTISMLATVQPALRRLGQKPGQTDASAPLRT